MLFRRLTLVPLTRRTFVRSAFLAASEDLHWPMQVDYSTASSEHRKAFEDAFHLLLDFQEM